MADPTESNPDDPPPGDPPTPADQPPGDGASAADAPPGDGPTATDPAPDDQPVATETQPARRRRRHTGGQRAVLVVNVIVVLACFIGAGALIAAKRVREDFVAAPRATYADPAPTTATTSTVAGAPTPDTVVAATVTPTTGPPETFPVADPQAMNFLITGSDNNACIDADSPYAGAVEGRDGLGNRSDTIMVLRLDPTTKAAAVLSFQRDLYVDIPGRADGRINTTFEKGKYDLMAATLEKNFGVKVDHFVQIDFCAFKQIVDAVGGVSVPFTYPVRDGNTGLNVTEPGCYAFSGDAALAYVRSRHLQYQDVDGEWKSDGTSDFGRIARQQDFLRRMLQAANSKGLFSPSVVRGLIDALQKYVVFDESFSIDDMLKFAGLLREIPPTDIHTYQVQSTGKTVSGNAVLLPQIDGANMKAILDIFRGTAALAGAPEQVDDTTTSAATSTEASTTTTTAVGSGPVGSGGPSTSTSTSTSTSVVDSTPVTNPEDITKGIVPDKNTTC